MVTERRSGRAIRRTVVAALALLLAGGVLVAVRPVRSAAVMTIVDENTVHEKRQLWTVPLRRIGDTVFVTGFRF